MEGHQRKEELTHARVLVSGQACSTSCEHRGQDKTRTAWVCQGDDDACLFSTGAKGKRATLQDRIYLELGWLLVAAEI